MSSKIRNDHYRVTGQDEPRRESPIAPKASFAVVNANLVHHDNRRGCCSASYPEAVEKGLQQATAKNPKLPGDRNLNALCEDFVLVPLDLVQKTVVDLNEHPQRGPRVSGDKRQERDSRFVVAFGTYCFRLQERPDFRSD
jgi:hypothetical protein